MKLLLSLFSAFFKVGLFTFGGGYAMLPLLQKEIVSRHWATDDEILDYYAIGQVTPGIIAVNVATFVGYKMRGVIGAIFTTTGLVMPSLLIIGALFFGFQALAENDIVLHAFAGVRIMIPALILPVVVQMIRKNVRTGFAVMLFSLALLGGLVNLSPVMVVCGGAGLAFLRKRKMK